MGIESWLLLGRLRRAVKKISFLLNFNINRWRLASTIGASSSSSSSSSSSLSKRRLSLSFNAWPGLRACTDDLNTYYYDSPPGSSTSSRGGGGGGGGGGLSRTTSCPSEDDIDKRAEMFIANFHRQLQIERQVSLELSYCRRANSFESASP